MPTHHFTRAIVRPPASNFAGGLTTVDLGAPDIDLTLRQHAAYCAALVRAGCTLIGLPADEAYPDSTFVEDTALILPQQGAILTRPGAPSRAGEVTAMRDALARFFSVLPEIVAPGTLDAGDVCEAGSHFFIGLSQRTNEEGARQLAAWLAAHGCTAATVDIRTVDSILHLKSGIACLAGNRLVLIDVLAEHPAFAGYEIIRVDPGDEYAANCVQVNDVVFVAAGFPRFHATLRRLGYQLEILDMSEYRKMDGGLSCLSLRF